MKRKTHTLKVAVPIPPTISAEDVVACLHAHTAILELQAFVKSWHQIDPSELPQSVRDDVDFFRAARHEAVPSNGDPEVKVYSIVEAIPIIPHVGKWAQKDISFPSRFQNVTRGLRAQANAPGGVVVQSDFRVEKIDGGAAMWQLTEQATVEASSLLLPFISGDMEKAHKDICQKLLDRVEADGRAKQQSPHDETKASASMSAASTEF